MDAWRLIRKKGVEYATIGGSLFKCVKTTKYTSNLDTWVWIPSIKRYINPRWCGVLH